MTIVTSDETSERLVGAAAIAAALHVSKRTAERWASTGRLPAVRTPGGRFLFDPAEVAASIHESSEVFA